MNGARVPPETRVIPFPSHYNLGSLDPLCDCRRLNLSYFFILFRILFYCSFMPSPTYFFRFFCVRPHFSFALPRCVGRNKLTTNGFSRERDGQTERDRQREREKAVKVCHNNKLFAALVTLSENKIIIKYIYEYIYIL